MVIYNGMTESKKNKRLRKWLICAALAVIVVAVSGCQTISFYSQAIKGQYQIFAHEKKIDELVASPDTPDRLKQRLELLRSLRTFAGQDLKLPVDGHYKKYADLHRPYVVWNVEAAPEFSLEPKSWWYPMLGRLDYRGYFSKPGANKYGTALRKKGYDVYVGGVEAYSTLGWFKDPILNTFVFDPDADLAEIIFHELGHQRVFARGDTDFNEAFATTVGQEGARRWLQKKDDKVALEKYAAGRHRTSDFVHLIARTREKLEKLYGDERNAEGKLKASKKPIADVEEMRRAKAAIYAQLQADYKALKESWGGNKEYDEWFAREINNAKLNSVAAYYDLVPGFERLLALNGGDLEKFYKEAERLSKMNKKERHQSLETLANSADQRMTAQ
jgi:predicted aminopeptidase